MRLGISHREPQMANPVSMKALRMIIKGVVHVNQQTCFSRWINKKGWQLFWTSCDNAVSQKHKHILTSSTVNHHRQSKSRHPFARARRKHEVLRAERGEERESRLPETPCALTSTTERFSFERELFKLVLVQRGCQIARAERRQRESCVIYADKKCSIQCARP